MKLIRIYLKINRGFVCVYMLQNYLSLFDKDFTI